MERKIGILANNIELENTILRLFGEDIKNGKIIVDILDSDKINEQGKILEEKGARAIIARSGGYIYTVEKVNVPVINLKISTLDILHAIKIAEKTGKDIILVLSYLEFFDYKEWKEMISANVVIEKFNYKEEIRNIVGKYADVRANVVIVGGGIPCDEAKKYNLDYVYIDASDESVRDAVSRAWELVDSLYEQRYKNEILNTTLDGVHDAVVAADNEGKIILYNERAKELLKRDRNYVMNRKISEVFPQLSFMADVLRNRNTKNNEIINLRRIVIAANVSLLKIDGQVLGVLCSFQDITKLQNLEKKIRFELNKKGLIAKYKFEDIIAHDQVMKDTLAKAVKIGLSDSTVMIYGESGTGKEMIAQSIHNISERKDEPFVAVNCAAISESLLESELFGYEEGAFTGARKGGKPGLFELAHRGTIFLDEINSVSLNIQTKLLRVLEEREVMRIGSDYVIPLDVRILSAANEGLKEKVEYGSFRKDLFYRLSILELYIPPLRDRKKDIVPIFEFYLERYSKSPDLPEVTEAMKRKLINYYWPGNVRELRNIAQRYIIFGELEFGEERAENDLNQESDSGGIKLDLKEIDRYVEKKVINMLKNEGMSNTDIAKTLGISRSSLWNKLNNK